MSMVNERDIPMCSSTTQPALFPSQSFLFVSLYHLSLSPFSPYVSQWSVLSLSYFFALPFSPALSFPWSLSKYAYKYISLPFLFISLYPFLSVPLFVSPAVPKSLSPPSPSGGALSVQLW